MSWKLKIPLIYFFGFCAIFGVIMILLETLNYFSLGITAGLMMPLVLIGSVGMFIAFSMN